MGILFRRTLVLTGCLECGWEGPPRMTRCRSCGETERLAMVYVRVFRPDPLVFFFVGMAVILASIYLLTGGV